MNKKVATRTRPVRAKAARKDNGTKPIASKNADLLHDLTMHAVFGGDLHAQFLRQMLESHGAWPTEKEIDKLRAEREAAPA